MSESSPSSSKQLLEQLAREKSIAKRAVGPRLRILLYVVLFLVALLIANSAYLTTITFLQWSTQEQLENYFYTVMFGAHLALGLVLIVPMVAFGTIHMVTSWNRKNRGAKRVGYALFAISIAVLLTGLGLMRFDFFELKQPTSRQVVYWAHVITPLLAMWLYWLHRLTGPKIKWRVGLAYLAVVVVIVGVAGSLHSLDPRRPAQVAQAQIDEYLHPSLARAPNFIPAETLMMDQYCQKCHQDVYDDHIHSAHRFSSFNNPVYRAAVRETRKVSYDKTGHVKASRWCAGCHDPVPFFSQAFDDPEFDDVKHVTSQAGITCTVCHAITQVNGSRGNADYTIEEPVHYPFAFSENPLLQFVNETLVKSKPSFHKQMFLKPDVHRTAEFCSTCHKVHLPKDVTNYKEFLRGQNHYDSYLLSAASGHGVQSFNYPEKGSPTCATCHMPLKESADFGSQDFALDGKLSRHTHQFVGANTGVLWLKEQDPRYMEVHKEFLKEKVRVDIFGVRAEGALDGALTAPLRPEVPTLARGTKEQPKWYLMEVVVRNLKVGHHFTQGTVDSNEAWLDITVKCGDKIIGRSGGLDDKLEVDRWAHYLNVFMLDKNGNRINRRNPQDIFVPLYDNQIPPGSAIVVHYALGLTDELTAPITVEAKLQYRKFDQEIMQYTVDQAKPGDEPIRGATPGKPYRNEVPITTMAMDSVTFPLEGVDAAVENKPRDIPEWQRWNDYGTALFITGNNVGGRGLLRQAEQAFAKVETFNRFDGPLNLARVYFREGRLDDAVAAISRVGNYKDPPAPPWTVAWFTGLVNKQQGHLDEAIANFRGILTDHTEEMRKRNFDFSLDYNVINELGLTLFERAKQERGETRKAERDRLLQEAIAQFERTLEIDAENVVAHHNLALLYDQFGDAEKAKVHHALHLKYKPDDNARGLAVAEARKKYPHANHAAEAFVIYSLHREGAPELPQDSLLPEFDPKLETTSTGGGE